MCQVDGTNVLNRRVAEMTTRQQNCARMLRGEGRNIRNEGRLTERGESYIGFVGGRRQSSGLYRGDQRRGRKKKRKSDRRGEAEVAYSNESERQHQKQNGERERIKRRGRLLRSAGLTLPARLYVSNKREARSRRKRWIKPCCRNRGESNRASKKRDMGTFCRGDGNRTVLRPGMAGRSYEEHCTLARAIEGEPTNSPEDPNTPHTRKQEETKTKRGIREPRKFNKKRLF